MPIDEEVSIWIIPKIIFTLSSCQKLVKGNPKDPLGLREALLCATAGVDFSGMLKEAADQGENASD